MPRSSRSPSRIRVWASPAEMRRPATASSRIAETERPEGSRLMATILLPPFDRLGLQDQSVVVRPAVELFQPLDLVAAQEEAQVLGQVLPHLGAFEAELGGRL